MLERLLYTNLTDAIAHSPAVALLGPRQVGKTTLALEVGKSHNALYLDLESEQDRAKLAQPELYLSDHQDKLIIVDEVHRAPGLFPILRGLIDKGRRAGRRAGQYLLLGSASLDLLKQSGETLAGRIAYLELAPFNVLETQALPADKLWVRGGFPESLLATDAVRSLRWRQDFIRTYLERDIPQFGPRIAAETLRRFWGMLAHHQGGLLNTAQFARNLGVDAKTAASYLDLLVDLLLVRRLLPWHANLGKRLVKSSKVYVRDSGLVHALLNITDKEALLAHPVIGKSWECFVIENLLACAPAQVQGYFYRSSGGAEIDLLLSWPDGTLWAVEIKRSLTPKVERGFHAACTDLAPARKFVVYPGAE
ncbi:MAG: ATP-binding protein, partial [Pseudomonadota bacterium]